jgi:predicted subunit of tRNA(5-methylaminomethyl-2-thiouridylate) methyltransferase
MKAGVLYSGGKDSSLAALMLSRDYEVELNTFVFNPARALPGVEKAAEALGFPHRLHTFAPEILDSAVESVIACGYPNEAINMVHRAAIDVLCREYRVVADGTRLDDRVPMLTRDEVQRLRDRCGCSYVRPLLGYGKPEIARLSERLLKVQYGETGTLENGDYEAEIREAVKARGMNPSVFFPSHHAQSLVIGRA